MVGGLGVAVLVGLVARPALAQAGCAQTLPSPLVTFCADTPALASQVNANFQGLVDFMTAKLGPLASSGVTVSGITSTGAVSASGVTTTGTVSASTVSSTTLSISGGASVGGALVVTGPVQSGCPSTWPIAGGAVDMVDMGAYCIMRAHNADTARNAKSWVQTNEYCVSRGLRLCTASEVNAATRLSRITTYPFASGDYWAWVDQTATDNNNVGFGGCHVNLNPDKGSYPLGDLNCAVDAYAVNPNVVGLCCL